MNKYLYVTITSLLLFFSSSSFSQTSSLLEITEKALAGDHNAQFFLGDLYYNGKGVRQDYMYAKYWFEKAAKREHSSAQFYLGIMHINGEGARLNYKIAKDFFGKSCDNGNQNGCNEYAKLYKQGY